MSLGVLAPELELLTSAVEAFCAKPCGDDEPLDIAASLVRKRAIIDRLELDFARDAARFARDYDENTFANPSPYSWMRENCLMASGAAIKAVTVGDQAASWL